MGRTGSLSGTLIILLGLAALLAAPGKAADFHLDVDHAMLDLGNISGVTAIDSTDDPPDPPASLSGTLTGDQVRIPRSGFVFPTKTTEVTNGLEATVDMTANQVVTGHYRRATGELSLSFDLKATIVALEQTCVIDPIRVNMSTRYGKPYLGVPFTGGLAGPGAMSGGWVDLPAPTGGAICPIVGQLTVGPGGIWMAHGLAAAQKCADQPSHPGCDDSNPCANSPCGEKPRPKLTLSVSPRSRKVKAGRATVLRVKVKNSGTARAAGLRLCVRVPRRKARTGSCLKLAVPARRTITRKVRIRTKRQARGSLAARLVLAGPGLKARTTRATIRLRR